MSQDASQTGADVSAGAMMGLAAEGRHGAPVGLPEAAACGGAQ
jgi:hypothetical protein